MRTALQQKTIDYFTTVDASPRIRDLAHAIGTSEAYAYKVVRKLENDGVLEIARTERIQGGRGFVSIKVNPAPATTAEQPS